MVLRKDKKVYSIILEKETHKKICYIAKTEDRSGSNFINYVLRKYVEEYEDQRGTIALSYEDIDS